MGWEALMEKWPWEGTGRGQTSCPAPLGLWLAGELLHHGLIPGVLALLGAGGAHVTAAEPPLFLPELGTCPQPHPAWQGTHLRPASFQQGLVR